MAAIVLSVVILAAVFWLGKSSIKGTNAPKTVMRLEEIENVEYHCPKCSELIK